MRRRALRGSCREVRLDTRLLQRIEQLHIQTREAYGAESLWQALRREGEANRRLGDGRAGRPGARQRSTGDGLGTAPAQAGCHPRQRPGLPVHQRCLPAQLKAAGLQPSMSRKGMPYDNAAIESFFSSLKHELACHERFASHDEAKRRLFRLHRGLLQPPTAAQQPWLPNAG